MAKIYSDSKGGCTKCGGTFTAKEVFKKLEYPVCSKCGEDPKLFRIRAKIVDSNFKDRYIDIRHAQDGQRLKDIFDCFTTLRQIENELESGKFDYRKYDSASTRESYLFQSFKLEYLEHHKRRMERKELSPGGFKNKLKYIRVLAKYFNEIDIASINVPLIDKFKDKFIEKFRTRDLALGELKAVLNYAERMEMIGKAPKFDLVPLSKKRKEIITMEQAVKVADAVEDKQYQLMIRLLLKYPVRPGELRALQWRDVDYFNKKVLFRRHFSNEIIIDGRKSVKDGEQAELEFPLSMPLIDHLHTLPRPLNSEEFIFKGKEKNFVSENCLARAWRKATQKLKMPPVQLYECRHARITQIIEQSNGNISTGLIVSGHTNSNTLLQRYYRPTVDLSEYFQ